MKYKHAQADHNRLLVHACLFFLFIVGLLIGVSYNFFKVESEAYLTTIKAHQVNQVSKQQDIFQFTFENISSDLKVLTGHNDFEHVINDPDEDLASHFEAIQRELLYFRG